MKVTTYQLPVGRLRSYIQYI